jgi:hypothetical protein
VYPLLLLFLLPGYALVRALFPGRGQISQEHEGWYLFFLTVLMGAVLAILYGFGLVAVSQALGGGGLFTPGLYWGGLALLTLGLFVVGWSRGAYPFLGAAPRGAPARSFDRSLYERLEVLGRLRDELTEALGGSGEGVPYGDDIGARLEAVRREMEELEARAREAME